MDLRKDASQQTRSIRCHQIPIDLTDRLKTNPAISRLSASPTPGNASRQSNAAQGVRETYIFAGIRRDAASTDSNNGLAITHGANRTFVAPAAKVGSDEGFSMRATAQGFGVGLTLARVDKPLKEEAVGC